MLELLHAVITSLLLSAAAGVGADNVTQAGDEEPANSETGVEVGKLPTQLVVPRGSRSQTSQDQHDDHQPTALLEQVAFCEPSICIDTHVATATLLPQAVAFHTAGRSP